MEIFTLATPDNLALSAILWDKQSSKSVLLLHMMPATKESWIDFASLLAQKGFNVLVIDFRGHGKSGGGDYQTFAPEWHQEYYKDVEAAVLFLTGRYPQTEVIIGGASIGANLSLKYLSEHPPYPSSSPSGERLGVRIAFALSAGLDYYGVRAVDYVKELRADQKVLFVGAKDDVRGSGVDCGTQVEQLYDLATSAKEKIVYQTGGHGTDMFATHPDLPEKIIQSLSAT